MQSERLAVPDVIGGMPEKAGGLHAAPVPGVRKGERRVVSAAPNGWNPVRALAIEVLANGSPVFGGRHKTNWANLTNE